MVHGGSRVQRMLKRLIVLSVVFALVVAEPAAKLTAPSYDDIGYYPTYKEVRSERKDVAENRFDVLAKSDAISLIFDLMNSVAGYKISAVTIAVAAIKWLVSNGVVLVIGAIATLGFCKLTGKCDFVEHLVPIGQLRSLVTPERLESAEEILVKAVKRYAEEAKSKN